MTFTQLKETLREERKINGGGRQMEKFDVEVRVEAQKRHVAGAGLGLLKQKQWVITQPDVKTGKREMNN